MIEEKKTEEKEETKKHPWWRPPLFATQEELQEKIDEYFEPWYRKKKITSSTWIEFEIPAITTSDLALYLGFESRQSIYDYSNREEFSYIIKKALFFIEREYEEKLLYSTNSTGAIFALKNMWWKDKTEVDNKISWELKTEVTDEQVRLIANRVLNGKWSYANDKESK